MRAMNKKAMAAKMEKMMKEEKKEKATPKKKRY